MIAFDTDVLTEILHLLQGIVQDEPVRARVAPQHQAAWQGLRDELADWERAPQRQEDEGVVPPDPSVVRLASEIASAMQERDMEPPGRLVPNGDGGLAFRWRTVETTWTVELDMDGAIESSLVRRGRLVWRRGLRGEPAA